MLNILAVGAHFDDVELGCGGSLKKLKDLGHQIFIFVGTQSGFVSATSFDKIRTAEVAKQEGQMTASLIGAELICGDFETFSLDYGRKLDTIITQIVEKYSIDLVFTHWEQDPHHDHWNMARAVFHGAKHVKRILAYRSSWYEADDGFNADFYFDISDYWEFKTNLLKCFKSEYERVGEKWIDFCQSDAIMNGLKNDCRYAEGFQCVRWLI